jgi:hypothetical protein
MSLTYKTNISRTVNFKGGANQTVVLDPKAFELAVNRAHDIIDQISRFEFDIFSVLGMRNLSAFVGELYASSLIKELGANFMKNPHQDGYPDLLLLDQKGKLLLDRLRSNGQIREKIPFSPFENGGIEVKATCGSVPTPDRCRRMGLAEKPDMGDQRIGVMSGYDWKAHHRETNNLAGILWDFIDGVPRIVAVFFSSRLKPDHWGAIVQPKEGGGRTTSVSIMTRDGVRLMYEDWITVLDSDRRYREFLNRHNRGAVL